MPTERYFVVKAIVPDDCSDSPVDAIGETLLRENGGIEWVVEDGPWNSLAAIGESLFDIDADPNAIGLGSLVRLINPGTHEEWAAGETGVVVDEFQEVGLNYVVQTDSGAHIVTPEQVELMQ